MEIKSAGNTRVVTLGRSPESLFLIDHPQSSRRHATIEVRNGKFYLSDKSTNGTYVKLADGSQFSVRRETIPLHGKGRISLGEDFPVSEESEIHFEID